MAGSLPAPLVAVALLTRLPVPDRPVDGPGTARAGAWFGVVGGLVGLLVAGVLLAADLVLPAAVAAVLAVAAELLLTGALHLDGLADCADGSAGRDPEQRLRIMRDHAVGVYGAAAVVLALLLRVTCLAALLGHRAEVVAGGLVAAYALSRAAVLLPARLLGYPREAGTGQGVVTGLGSGTALAGGLLGVSVAAGAVLAADPAAGVRVALAVTAALLAAGAVAVWARARLGGATGDVLGATAEAALSAVLLVLVAAP